MSTFYPKSIVSHIISWWHSNSWLTPKISHKWSLQRLVIKLNAVYYSRMNNKGRTIRVYHFFYVICEPIMITKKQLSTSFSSFTATRLMHKMDMFKIYLWTNNRTRPLLCPFWLKSSLLRRQNRFDKKVKVNVNKILRVTNITGSLNTAQLPKYHFYTRIY